MSSRRRPLHTCGASFLAIAHSASSRAQNVDGRLGSTTRKIVRLAKLVNPLISVLQYQCLLVLSFIDDRLLAIANIVEMCFPPSKRVFDKIDDFLNLIETFPLKFDDAVDKLPCFNRVLFLEWVVTHAISLLKSMITILMNWGRDGTREKEILVDMNYNEDLNGGESADKSECCSEGTVSSLSETQKAAVDEKRKSNAIIIDKEVLKMGRKWVGDDGDCKQNEKSTCKRALKEEGTRDAMDGKEDCKINGKSTSKKLEKGIEVVEESVEKADGNEEIPDQSNKGIISNEDNSEVKDGKQQAGIMEDYECEEEASKGSRENEDEILELFETAWLMKPTVKRKGNLMPRSASFV